MALILINKQILVDDINTSIIKFYLNSVSTADADNQMFLDTSILIGSPPEIKIMEIRGTCVILGITLKWEANENLEILDLYGPDFIHSYKKIGGLPNNAGSGKTGNILFDTVNTNNAKSRATIIMKLTKEY